MCRLITGFGAVLFRALIGLIHNIGFLGSFTIAYDASVFTPPSPWGVFVIFVSAAGGILVTFLINNFAPEAARPRCEPAATWSISGALHDDPTLFLFVVADAVDQPLSTLDPSAQKTMLPESFGGEARVRTGTDRYHATARLRVADTPGDRRLI